MHKETFIMIRNLLATTAIATLLATGAMAQSSTTTPSTDATQPAEELRPAEGAATQDSAQQPADATAQDSTQQPADTTAQDSTTTTVEPTEETAQGTQPEPAEDTAQTTTTTTETDTQTAGQNPPVEGHLASNLIGSPVYNGVADDAETIGDVTDVVIGNDGKAEYVVIGVGGFLGIGQKDVAIEYETLQWAERDGEMLLVVETTQEQLEQQPAFDRTAYDPEAMAAQEQQASQQEQQPAATGMTTTETATAPATTSEPMETEEQAATTGEAMESEEQPAEQAETTTTTVPVEETETAEAPATDAQPEEQPAEQAETTTVPVEETETAEAPATTAEESTDATQTAAIDRSTLQEADMGAIQAEQFIGTTVYGANEEQVGEIGDVILTQDGQVDAVLVDVGGFLGMGEKQVAVAMDNLQFMQDADGNLYLYTNWTQEQLEAQPAYDEATYAENRDTMRIVVEEN
jgi:sporulation protein YlmC with PRC-barrel domain